MAKKDPFIEWLQSRLTSHGFPCGAIDGILGPVTTKALVAFQRARGLPQTGTATEATVTALRLTSVGSTPRPVEPAAPQTDRWPRQKDMQAFYGKPGENLATFEIPYPLRLSWDKGTIVRKMTLNRKCGPSAVKVLEEVERTYNEAERRNLGLDLFGGSYNNRTMRGGTAISTHAYGIAIDFDPERNGLNTKAPQARLSHADAIPFWQAWEREGWVSLGRARNFDFMHVQAARL